MEGKRQFDALHLDDGRDIALLVVGGVVGRYLDLERVAGGEPVALGRDLEAGVVPAAGSVEAAVRASGDEPLERRGMAPGSRD